ncbi:MAG: hypothetical protein K8I02_10645 [Candidatus Methylomirabilis sp.]|nr:hypothetical protein [Deltaproteobacteria bacterium]
MGEAALDQTISLLRADFVEQNRERADRALRTLAALKSEEFDADNVYFFLRFFHQYVGVAQNLGFPKPQAAVYTAIWDLRQAMNGLRPIDDGVKARLREATDAVRGAIESETD